MSTTSTTILYECPDCGHFDDMPPPTITGFKCDECGEFFADEEEAAGCCPGEDEG